MNFLTRAILILTDPGDPYQAEANRKKKLEQEAAAGLRMRLDYTSRARSYRKDQGAKTAKKEKHVLAEKQIIAANLRRFLFSKKKLSRDYEP